MAIFLSENQKEGNNNNGQTSKYPGYFKKCLKVRATGNKLVILKFISFCS